MPHLCVCLLRCRDCGAVLEEYDEETLALAVVVLSMFIHLSPDLAAPLLLEIMQSVGRYARITAADCRHVHCNLYGFLSVFCFNSAGWPRAPISQVRLKGELLFYSCTSEAYSPFVGHEQWKSAPV